MADPVEPKLRPIVLDARTRRDLIRSKTAEGLAGLFPLIGRDHELHVEDVRAKPLVYSSNDQKSAILHGRSLVEPIVGNLVLKDKLTGAVIDTKKNHILAHLPYFTERHTMIVSGNEYELPNQLRLKPGIYTRERDNGEFEASFNLSKGMNFRLAMEPETGKLHAEFGSTTVPLYQMLKALGVPDADIRQAWGTELLQSNAARKTAGSEEALLNKLIMKVKRSSEAMPQTLEAKKEYLHKYFKGTAMDASVSERTLGKAFDHASPMAMLEASKKLIGVHRGDREGDDRDSLEFKTLHSVDDFFKERLEKDAKKTIGSKLTWKMNQSKSKQIKDFVPNSTFTRSLTGFLTTSAIAGMPTQISPMEIIDHASKITSLGEGGITNDRAIPIESRKVHNTHYGIIDTVRTPESFKAGIDVRAAMGAYRDDAGNLYARMVDARTGKVAPVAVTTLAKSTVGFSNQGHRTGNVDALRGTDTVSVKRKDVDYYLEDPTHQFTPTVALVPMLNTMQGNRAIMGSKYQTQSMPLVERDVPYVQSQAPRSSQSMEREVARLIVPTSAVHGTVERVDKDYIYIRPDAAKHAAESAESAYFSKLACVEDFDGCDDAYIPADLTVKTAAQRTEPDSDGLIRVPYDTMFPLASKTHLHNDVTVKAGDKVTPGQQLAGSNFTRDGHIALGKNLSVGYMAYYGKNSNDAIVISEGAAKKLTSENMYKETLRKSGDTIISKDKYKAYYGTRFTGAQLDKLDENGVAKPGVKIEPGDPLILALEKAAVSPDTAMLGHLHKSLVKPYRDAAVIWEHQSPAEVVDAVQAARQIVVTAKTLEPMRLGDKLANRFGGKGVVADIIPDHQMVQDEKGKPIDILFTSAGVVSRINPGQIVESALGKVVEKTGTPYVLAQFQRGNMVDFARKELEKHDLKDKETVYDPISGKHIPKVFVGRSYIHRLFKDSDTNFAARGVTSYDVNQQPTKGGDVGAKGLGKMEINTLLAHNARNVLQESLTTKSERSDAYWRALEFGLPPPPPKTPFVTEKFSAMLKGSGINVDKSGTSVSLHALTDAHVAKLSSGALTLPTLEKSTSFMVTAKDLKPEKGGLFDPVLTGGLSGTRWAHIDLPEPTVSPVFEDATRRLLGLTKGGLREALASKGGQGIAKDLNAIDLGRKEAELIAKTKKARGADLDDAVKQLKYVRALKDHGFAKAGDAYITSKIAVIPPVMRPILPSQQSGELQVSDSNYLYRDMALAAAGLKAAQGVGLPGLTSEARTHMYDAVAALAGVGEPVSPQLQGRGVKGFLSQISGQTSPKQGFLFKKVLKRQQDLSGRATATPDTTLDMDQIGVPEDMLWTTYEKFIMKGLIAQGFPAPRAVEMIKEKHPAAKKVLDMELAQRPVFVNRAPSLHKHNFVAAYPVAIPGKSLRVNPFMEKGMNLDYDGDTMQLHVPVSNKAMAEAQQLTLKQLLFGDKSRDNLMVFPDHESIIGAYLATMGKATGAKKKFKDKAEAMAAYKRGEISLETPVEIG